MDISKKGTLIHGVAASEHLDSSGERIHIKGVDISSLEAGTGVFNFEHNSDKPSSIVGKIIQAKKIFSIDDCENEHHVKFWHQVKMPFLYVMGELFDAVGHKEAMEVAAMLRYDSANPDSDANLINFSIEGARLKTVGSDVFACIARKVAITITPCNKVCSAEELIIKEKTKEDKPLLSLIFGKSEQNYCEAFGNTKCLDGVKEIQKSVKKVYETLKKDKYSSSLGFKVKPKTSRIDTYAKPTLSAGGQSKTTEKPSPKRVYSSTNTPDKMKAGDRIVHTPSNKNGTAVQPKRVFTPENAPEKMKVGDRIQYNTKGGIKKSKKKIKKAMTAGGGSGMASPGTLVNDISSGKLAKSNAAYERFEKKEELLNLLKERHPDQDFTFILALAKTIVYGLEKREEEPLERLLKEIEG